MSDRDRLIELIEDTLHEWECDVQSETLTQIAEHLIENGVIVPIRCKDCMFYKHTEIGDCMACVRQTAYKKPNDFCSCAKLKERENNA